MITGCSAQELPCCAPVRSGHGVPPCSGSLGSIGESDLPRGITRSACIVAAVLLMAIAVSAQTALTQGAAATKGHELYSWKVKGRWHYSLLDGTNRARTTAEITAKETERIGMDAIKRDLKKLAPGEQVTWMSAAPGTSRQKVGKTVLQLPSRHRINRLKAYCEKLGLKFSLH